MRVRPQNGRLAGTIRVLLTAVDRCLVFDPKQRRSRSAFMGTDFAELSGPSFVFIQGLDEKGSAPAIERTAKEMLMTIQEGFSCFHTAAGASKASIRPVLEERPGVVCVTMKTLNQCFERLQTMGPPCTTVADPFEVHYEGVWHSHCPIGSPDFARGVSTEGIFSLERHGACTGYVVLLMYNRCLLFNAKPETESDYFYGQPTHDQSFAFVKILDETEGNAYAFKRTSKDILTTLLEDIGASRRWPLRAEDFRSAPELR
ncbi:uncharacterized protein LOC142776976 [Rhipicephalus microplus]|uniref:uncharacterized protein LOC142776976 n=1 Tax=Rhipicephalus microplus TaxID=6941 RepID=UPI003F6D302F